MAKNLNKMTLPTLNLPLRVLFTGYLVVIGLGLMMSAGQIMLTHGMADGEFGLSVDDIVYSYYGNRDNSKLEVKLKGSMKDKAPVNVRMEMVKWARNGAKETEWDAKVKGLFEANCNHCHGVIPGLPDFTKLQTVQQVAKTDQGATISSLTRVSHIHLFGIAFIFFFVGLIFSFATNVPRLLQATAIGFPFLFLLVDVFSWWLTKFYPGFAWMTILGGIGYNLASAYMMLTSLYQMWVVPYRLGHKPASNSV